MNLKENSLIKLRKPRCKKPSKEDTKSLQRQLKVLQGKIGEKELKGDQNGAENVRKQLQRVKEKLCMD
ncbi:hypothetical protein FG386_003564 [Cryptosporidium ryanae]|uniref:uncharacterized protein n=1 Tax=Cryptosporidium ryanae TaxID=515981 RepID=UPI00351A5DC0|nr:hypothetical protein FG386_003564 [Cryptosporidium ryanae]